MEQTNSSIIGEIEDGEFIPEDLGECMDPSRERNRPLKRQLGTRTNYNPHHCPRPKCSSDPPKLHRWPQSRMQYDIGTIDDATGTALWICLAWEESRRVINAMKKTVEISNGNEDFAELMKAEFGKDVMQSWQCSTKVFEEATGLRLIPDSE